MSEFSDSCHVRATESQMAVDILRAAKVPGHVFGASAGWVPFVFPLGSQLGLEDYVERVVAANTGLMVRYTYAEDHACSALVYQGPDCVAKVTVSFESKKRGHFDRATFVELGLLTAEDADHVERWVADPKRDPGLLVVASRLRLPRHELFAHDDNPISRDHIEVRADGSVHFPGDVPAQPEASPEEGGPVFELTVALVEELVQSKRLVLVSGAAPTKLAEDLAGTLSELEGADPATAVVRSLTHHELVDEHFADATSIRVFLQRFRVGA